jgi:hypothetical protein
LGAVLAPERSRDAIFDGMKAKRTYATTGDRIILKMDVNGTTMGQRGSYSETRIISGRAIGTAPIKSVQLYKNDEEIWQQEYLLEDSPGSEQELLLSFTSDATPHFNGDAPRGWRHWRGEMTVTGAELKTATAMDFVNPTTQAIASAGNTARFSTHTRGDTSSIRLSLSDVQADATITLNLEETTETGSAPPFYRFHATIPATRVEISLGDIVDGRLTRNIPQADYPADNITIRRVINGGTREVNFAFTDTNNPDQGDYYYFKVEQANDAVAWSSPGWVGGFSSQ